MSIEQDGWQVNLALIHLYRGLMRQVELATGMSQSRLDIIRALYTAEMTQADLQHQLGVEGPGITRLVKQLEAEGLVTRRPDPSDNRYTRVALTPAARKLHARADLAKFAQTFGAQLMAGLTARERAELLRLLGKVSANLAALRTATDDRPDAPN
jgi:DNA-binding MarR family transcriptional regulator